MILNINIRLNKKISICVFTAEIQQLAAEAGARQCPTELHHTWHYHQLFTSNLTQCTLVHPLEAPSPPLSGHMVTVHGPQFAPVAVIRERPVSTGALSLSLHSGGWHVLWEWGKVVYLPHKITRHHWRCHIARSRLVLKQWHGPLWTGLVRVKDSFKVLVPGMLVGLTQKTKEYMCEC